MSKAILIVDMPSNCRDCQFIDSASNYMTNEITFFCHANEDVLIGDVEEERDILCPLKCIPGKLDDLGLEVWNNRKGNILAPKGLFDEIFESDEE